MTPVADNILDLLDNFGEPGIRAMLARFRCAKNPAIEQFLKNNAIHFSRQGLSITYIVSRSTGETTAELLGFFTLTYKMLRLGGGSLSRAGDLPAGAPEHRQRAECAFVAEEPPV